MGADLAIQHLADAAREKYGPLLEHAMKALAANPNDSPERQAAIAEVRRCWAPHHEGIFRDSYNPTGVLWTLGMDWRMDVMPLLDEHHMLRGDALNRFLSMVEAAKQELPPDAILASLRPIVFSLDLIVERLDIEKLLSLPTSPDTWRFYFIEKRLELIHFLRRAVEMGEGVVCSL